MFDRTKQGLWWDIGLTLVEGCNPVSEGCLHCWAIAGEKRFKKWDGQIHFKPERMKRIRRKKPTAFAIWNDLFHHDMKHEDILNCITMFSLHPEHRFLILTKRPKSAYFLLKDVKLPDNIWFGTTMENQNDERMFWLLQIPAAVRFVSAEPMLGPINLIHMDIDTAGGPFCQINALTGKQTDMGRPCPDVANLNWVICGAETGPRARHMDQQWAIDLKLQCKAAGVPFFFKKASKGEDTNPRLNVREYPNTEK